MKPRQNLKEILPPHPERLEIDLDTAALEDRLDALIARLEELDVSLDYLAAAFTGETPLGIDVSQSALGRAARPRITKGPQDEIST